MCYLLTMLKIIYYILLNDKKIINLKVFDWICILEDLGKPKLSALAPSHLKND